VANSAVLFSRLEEAQIAELRDRYSGSQSERKKEPKERPADERFMETVDLRVAKIVKIEKHPKADKLYIETLDIAGEERVIVSGLVPFYTPEELLGRHIIVAYNLKPAKLRGVESRGMLLAASCAGADGGEIVEVLDGSAVPTGTRAHLEGMEPPAEAPPEISIDGFSAFPMEVRDGKVYAGGKALCLEKVPVRTSRVANGEAH
jgi:methionyl-tRNA synthetase